MKKNIKENKKKRIIIRIILVLAIVIVTMYFILTHLDNPFLKKISLMNNPNNEYKIIKLDTDNNYSGIGQEKVNNKDGYFTTFTAAGTNKRIYKEYKQNSDSSWSNNKYWDGTMADSGCGITAISIILSGYNKNYTPEDLRKKYYPVLNNDSISKELSHTFKLKNSGFYYDSTHLSNDHIKEYLKTDRPILICVWTSPSKNRWTTASHYMVLLAADDNNMVYVSNPNGLPDSSKSSGWYDINEVVPYIAKALYIEDY